MNSLLTALVNSFREDFGFAPTSLMRLVAKHPEIAVPLPPQASDIYLRSVVAWQKIGTPQELDLSHRPVGSLLGWKTVGSHYRESFTVQRSEFADLVTLKKVPNFTCDIRDVHGFAASRSNLEAFASTDEMVELNGRNLIADISADALAANLADPGIDITSSTPSDYFVHHDWDGRLYLVNSDGSHHLSAAKYIAKRIRQSVPLTGRLHSYCLNMAAIESLRRDYAMFVISDEPEIANGFGEAMRLFNATWLWHVMPPPYANMRLILLPKNERPSRQAGAVLRQAGCVDLGEYLLHHAMYPYAPR